MKIVIALVIVTVVIIITPMVNHNDCIDSQGMPINCSLLQQ